MSGRGPGSGDQPMLVLASLQLPCPDEKVGAALNTPHEEGCLLPGAPFPEQHPGVYTPRHVELAEFFLLLLSGK